MNQRRMNQRRMNQRRTTILILFFLTGISTLIYQVAWVRQATLVFGMSIYAYSAVLAAFMGGTALGSYFLGKRADGTQNPLRLYALLQVGVALFGVISPFALQAIMPLYANIAQSLAPSSIAVIGIRAAFSILLLVPPTFLLGATLPVMARALVTQGQKRRSKTENQVGEIGSDIGQLYAADTLGAALGCGLAGLFLLRIFGTQETIFLAVFLNLMTGVYAYYLSSQSTSNQPASTPAKQPTKPTAPAPAFTQRFILWAYALSGFIALGYEIAWARILAVFTLDAVFSFSIMLTTFLTGLAIGGWIGAWWMRRQKASSAHFSNIQVAIGLSSLAMLFIFARLPQLNMETPFGDDSIHNINNVIYFEFLLGFITLLLPTILLGLLFPIVVSLYTQEQPAQIGLQIGRINAFNTAGALLGSLVVGFGLMPLMGLQATVAALAVLNIIIGVIASWLPTGDGIHSRLIPQGGLALGIIFIMLLPSSYYLGFREEPSEHMLFYAEGAETTVAVFDLPTENFKVSFVDGRIETSADEVRMRAFRLLGHLPPLLKPDGERALMLNFGNGIATGSLEIHGVPAIDAVALSAQQFEAAAFYGEENHQVLNSPKLNPYVEDGRNFLLQTPHQYDIITTDATHPVNTRNWALFTQEFYESVSARLTDDGLFMQWVPFHNLRESDYKKILRTYQAVFPHATLWYTGGSHTLLLATPQRLTPERLAVQLEQAAGNELVTELITTDLGPPPLLSDYLVMDEDKLAAYAGDGALSQDNNAFFLPYNHEIEAILAVIQAAAAERLE